MNSHIESANVSDITFTINGKQVKMVVPNSLLLIDMLRENLSLKGTKPGCLEGECGACTVIVDGVAVNSCLYLAINVNGKEVTTIEGLTTGDYGQSLDAVQEAMIQYGAVQCGFCSPGVAMSIKSFYNECIERKIIPSRDQIKKALEGNLCRCTGYVKIIEAVESLFEES